EAAPVEAPAAESAAELATERLIHNKSGMEFPFALGPETTIGRKDPVTGIYPDIDLTPVDGQRSISRRHAKIYRRGNKYFLSEEIGTMNGTYRNSQRLETGVPVEIRPGDELRFGMVVTSFRQG
nr:FHA domain-containing protein [Thermoanaerobaculia bacterium]